MCTTYNALRNSMVFDFTFHEPTSTRRTGKWRTVEETNPHARISDFCREPLSIFEVSASYVNQIPDIQCQIIVRLFVDSPWLEVGAWRHSLHRWDTHTMGMLIKSEVTTSAASTRDISQKRLSASVIRNYIRPMIGPKLVSTPHRFLLTFIALTNGRQVCCMLNEVSLFLNLGQISCQLFIL